MKIVQFMASAGWGGAESVFVSLAGELARDHEVTAVLLRDTVYEHRFSPAVRIRVLRANPTRYNPLLSLELLRLLHRLRPDVVHTHAAKAAELLRPVCALLGIPLVATKHNARKGRIFNRLSRVTAVSKLAADSILPCPGARIKIIANGIRPQALPRVERGECFTMVAVGRLDAIKGFDLLIDQVQDLPFEFRLRIVGEGPEEKRLQQRIQRSGCGQRIELTGFRDDVPLLMKKSHLVVISSLSEGFGNILIEALFYAPCLISTPVGESAVILPELLLAEHGELGNRISQVHARYHEFVAAFEEVKEQHADNYLLPAITRRYVDFYREVVTKRRFRGEASRTPERKAK